MRIFESWGGQKTYGAVADEALIEIDEDGFHLVVKTDEGDLIEIELDRVAEAFLESAVGTIGAWVAEREAARGTAPPRIAEEDLEGYERGDPKRVTLEREIH